MFFATLLTFPHRLWAFTTLLSLSLTPIFPAPLLLLVLLLFVSRFVAVAPLDDPLILALVFADGRLSFEFDFVEDGAAEIMVEREDVAFDLGRRIAALVSDFTLDLFALGLIFGFSLAFGGALVFVALVGIVLASTLAAAVDFLTPTLRDLGFNSFCFLLRREVDSSSTCSTLRFVPVRTFSPFPDFRLSLFSAFGSLGRWSLGFGPKTPRHVGAPQRHSWTFF